MRRYRIIVQKFAVRDLDDAYQNAARNAPDAAAAWLNRFAEALQSLEQNPDRCAIAHENLRSRCELREFLFGRRPNVFRVIFTIDGNDVRILRIRRSARRFLSRREIEDSLESDDSLNDRD